MEQGWRRRKGCYTQFTEICRDKKKAVLADRPKARAGTVATDTTRRPHNLPKRKARGHHQVSGTLTPGMVRSCHYRRNRQSSIRLKVSGSHARKLAVEPHLKSYDDIVAHCCDAWRILEKQPWRIMSIGRKEWASRF
jgi:hypothetical protein